MSKAGSSSSKTGGPDPSPPKKPASRAGSPVLSDLDQIHRQALISIKTKPSTIDRVLAIPAGPKRTKYIIDECLPQLKNKQSRQAVHKAWPDIPPTPTPSRPNPPPPSSKRKPLDPTTPTPKRILSPQ